MNHLIKKSLPTDAEKFIEIKNRLSLKSQNQNTSTTGGFLLGTDLETYRFFIRNCYCLSCEVNNNFVGFGIVLPDNILKSTELWQKRNYVKLDFDLKEIENSNIIYFDQLAFLKGYSKLALATAYNLVKPAFENGAQYLLTTTVNKPVTNLAAVPFILNSGGKKIGSIDEHYPEVGSIVSDIYLLKADSFLENVKKSVFFPFLKSCEIKNLFTKTAE